MVSGPSNTLSSLFTKWTLAALAVHTRLRPVGHVVLMHPGHKQRKCEQQTRGELDFSVQRRGEGSLLPGTDLIAASEGLYGGFPKVTLIS